MTFKELNLNKNIQSAIDEMGFVKPTPIQAQAFSVIRGGKNIVGISQTGTGKTLAFLLPIIQDLKFSKQVSPRVLILVPTRELVQQMVEAIESLIVRTNIRAVGVYGGTNINTQKIAVMQGADIVVGTPGRTYDLALSGALKMKTIKKLVIDEVDVMMDLGFIFQLTNIFELLPEKRQNIMFSATMTEEIDVLIEDFFIAPVKISIAVSGTPLDNIAQSCYAVPNFYTKANLIAELLRDKEEFSKVLIFTASKKHADRLFNTLEEEYGEEMGVIHSNKSQNYRFRSIMQFDSGTNRILISTDIMARGLDLDKITHVINMDTPSFPENYMHRIGRTGRAEQEGKSILLYTEKEEPAKEAIESLMDYEIPVVEMPEAVEYSSELIPEEREQKGKNKDFNRNKQVVLASGFHEKKDKNKKVNDRGAKKRKMLSKYKKPKSRGDKIQNRLKKKKKRR